jgi:capsular exopolysaccharide synthesis family protein
MSSQDNDTIFSYYDEEAPVATELRRLYHNAKERDDGTQVKSFLITSSNRGEGKSTIASWLAMTVAQFRNKKVLLVDADLRRPRVNKIFGLDNPGGLMECLSDGADPLEVVKQTRLDGLHIITGGERTRAPGKLFESEMLREVFDKLKFYYDIVIVDSAPVLAVSDTLFLCSVIESILLVVMAGVTPREVVSRTKNVLLDSRASVAGVVLNNANQVLPYYYDYSYYGYQDKDDS